MNNSDKPSATSTTTTTPVIDTQRRKTLSALGFLGVAGATGLIGCGGGSSGAANSSASSSNSSGSALSSSTASSVSSATSSAEGICTLIPTETIGPYPLSTFLDNSTVLREDITEGKTGVPLQVKLKLVNVNNACTPVSAYVYIWHCDKDGNYSGYSGESGKTYCRGVQYTNGDGIASFTTIFPGWYVGRITHIHFQIFLTSYGSTAHSTAISQMAFPQDVTTAVYNSSLYASHGQNTSVTSFSADNVFSDGVEYQLANMSGSVDEGYVAELTVGIAV